MAGKIVQNSIWQLPFFNVAKSKGKKVYKKKGEKLENINKLQERSKKQLTML